jgi:three-Cys-motif partner protein
MVEKRYAWANGAILEDHSRRKHKILREYLFNYLAVRCQLPQQSRFRLAIIDGFAGGGRYVCGAAGSPIIFLEELNNAVQAVNLQRAAQKFGTIEVECLLILNDDDREVIEVLKGNVTPLHAAIKQAVPALHLRIQYLNQTFENVYPMVKRLLTDGRYRNVLFNLDQCGHSHVERKTLTDIMRSFPSAEVFYTFAIEALISFLRKSEPAYLASQLAHIGLGRNDLKNLEGLISRKEWLGAAERVVFEAFRTCAPFVSPFSINNPDGWRYWLIHFANSYRARQVYNNILHNNSSAQAHFGRSGLNMLAYSPEHEGGLLYLFDDPDRQVAKAQLYDDIPRLVSESGDAIDMATFYSSIYNITPAHADDIHEAIIDNPDFEVITPTGGKRRKASGIAVNDFIKLNKQTSFFPMFLGSAAKIIRKK